MKRVYLFCVFACISFNVQAQNVENPCNFTYSVDVVKNSGTTPEQQFSATMSWDFSGVGASADIAVEIMPIRDCWNELSGTQFGTPQTIRVDATRKGSTQLSAVSGMRAKCFKWRSVIVGSGCSQTSEWKYFEIIPKRS